MSANKSLYVIRSISELDDFVNSRVKNKAYGLE